MFFNATNHNISKSALVGFSAQNMFDLVNKIPDYPQFLSWCNQGTILEQNSTQIIASLLINKGLFSQSFTTINQLSQQGDNLRIELSLKDGPFKSLNGAWQFNSLSPSSCQIDFSISFSFDNKLLDMSISPVFKQIANTQLDAFISRAKVVYG